MSKLEMTPAVRSNPRSEVRRREQYVWIRNTARSCMADASIKPSEDALNKPTPAIGHAWIYFFQNGENSMGMVKVRSLSSDPSGLDFVSMEVHRDGRIERYDHMGYKTVEHLEKKDR